MKRVLLVSLGLILVAGYVVGCLPADTGGTTGSAGTSGGQAGTTGTPGTAGTSDTGTAGTFGDTGTAGTDGTAGTNGQTGSAGTSATGTAGTSATGTAGTSAGGTGGGAAGRGGTTGTGGGGTTGRGGTTGTGGGGTTGRGGTTGTGGGGTTGRGGTTGSGGSGGAPNDAMAVGDYFQGQTWALACGPNNSGTQRVCFNNNTSASAIGRVVSTNTYPHDNPLARTVNRNDFSTVPGTAGQAYCITVNVRGVTEAKAYVNDTITNRPGTPFGVSGNIAFGNTTDANAPDGMNGWTAGGMPTPSGDYNVYGLLIDWSMVSGAPTSPARQIYYLNSINTSGTNRQNHTAYTMNYNASFTVYGGSRVQFFGADYNANAIRNCAEPQVESECNPLPNLPVPTGGFKINGQIVTIQQPINGQLITMSVTASRAGACTCTNPASCT